MSKTEKAQKNHAHLEELRFPEVVFIRRCKILNLKTSDLVCTFGHFKTKLLDFGVATTRSELDQFFADVKEKMFRNYGNHSERYFNLDNCDNISVALFSYVEDLLYKRIVDIEERDVLIKKLAEEFRGYPNECFHEFMRI